MKCIIIVLISVASALAQQQPEAPPPPPQVRWGKCPQLEPSAEEQKAKGEVIEQCLQKNPPPSSPSLTQEEVDTHRETITTCALKTEGWFNDDGTYKFDRAKKEIEGKKLSVATEILQKHDECTKEAKENFPENKVQQVQLYQACMDYHITKVCEIQIVPPPQAGPPSSAQA